MYYSLKIRFEEDLYDSLCLYLYQNNILSFEEGEMFNDENGDYSLINETSLITIRSNSEKEINNLHSQLLNQFNNLSIVITKDENDYLNEWKKYAKPIEVSKNIIIYPSFHETKNSNHSIKLKIDPAYAFGSGSHQTSLLCLRAIERLSIHDNKNHFLDVGTGSGILSILAVRLGFKQALGVDIDPLAINAANENALINETYNCNFSCNSLSSFNQKFDLVVANILSSVLIELKTELLTKVNNSGFLVLSGILENEVNEIIEVFGFKNYKVETLQEWALIEAQLIN